MLNNLSMTKGEGLPQKVGAYLEKLDFSGERLDVFSATWELCGYDIREAALIKAYRERGHFFNETKPTPETRGEDFTNQQRNILLSNIEKITATGAEFVAVHRGISDMWEAFKDARKRARAAA